MVYTDYAIPAMVVGGSVDYDIAVLKVTGSEILKNSYATSVSLGDSEGVRVFDEVFAVGNPEGFGMAVTEGIISVDSEGLDMTGADGSSIKLRVMRISAAINEGNSGGGLYDEDSKLIGIVCAKRIGSDIDNMAYAIPVNLAKNLADNIIDNCNGTTATKVQRAYIGVEITAKVIGLVADPTTGELYRAERVEVGEIKSECIIKDEIKIGDVINSLTIDGVTVNVTRVHHITDHMLTARVGSEISVNVTRDGESFDIEFIVTPSTIKAEK
jgi:serine protease Do